MISLRPAAKDAVTFLDVGQGDGICLQSAGGKTYLFDCGSSSRSHVGRYVLKPFLKYHGISHIDGIFLSHPDADHYNGIEELLIQREKWGITVGQVFLSPAERNREEKNNMEDDRFMAGQGNLADSAATGSQGSKESGNGGKKSGFKRVMEAAARGNNPVPCAYIYAGDKIQTEGITITCLHPLENYYREDGNLASQCFLVDFGENTMLLTGDVEKEGEERLLQEMWERGIGNVTVLKAAHHGSANSASEEFLARTSPALTIISCGRNNRYGHPHKELLERVSGAGSEIWRTEELGAITLEFDGRGMRGYFYSRE